MGAKRNPYSTEYYLGGEDPFLRPNPLKLFVDFISKNRGYLLTEALVEKHVKKKLAEKNVKKGFHDSEFPEEVFQEEDFDEREWVSAVQRERKSEVVLYFVKHSKKEGSKKTKSYILPAVNFKIYLEPRGRHIFIHIGLFEDFDPANDVLDSASLKFLAILDFFTRTLGFHTIDSSSEFEGTLSEYSIPFESSLSSGSKPRSAARGKKSRLPTTA